jgi:hypothetical protein
MDTNNLYGTVEAPKVVYQANPNAPRRPVLPQFNTIKLAFIIIGLVLVGEIIWAGYTLTRPIEAQDQNQKSASVATAKPVKHATLSLLGDSTAKVGTKISVTIQLDVNDEVDASDIVMTYDPKKLQLQPSGTSGTSAVQTGQVFSDYPVNTFDAKDGRVLLSGITSLGRKGFTGQGVVGTVTFNVVGTGSSNVTLDFTPGSTKDSNVIGSQADNDILTEVQNLKIDLK